MSDADGTAYLWHRLGLVAARVRRLLTERRRDDPAPDDPFRGLYLSTDDVERLLARPAEPLAADPADLRVRAEVEHRAARTGATPRLHRLARDFGLTELDVEVLLVALLPDVDPRYERLYGYLNDDVSRRRATVGLALELCGISPGDAAGRSRFAASAPLVDGGLLRVEQPDQPYLSRPLRVPDRVTAHLLGDDTVDARLAEVAWPLPDVPAPADDPSDDGPETAATARRLGAALRAGVRLGYLRERPGAAADDLAVAALVRAGRPVLRLDLDALAADPDPADALAATVREARLRGAGLVAGPVQALDPAGKPEHARLLRRIAHRPVPVLLTGAVEWDPQWTSRPPLLVTAPPLDEQDRARLWRTAGGGWDAGRPAGWTDGVDPVRELAPYQLGPDQLRRAAQAADQLALFAGADRVGADHLRAGVRGQNAGGLARLARRIEPAVGWDDLVLPDPVLEQLRELALRVRYRDRVLGRWRMRPGGGRGRGVLALFAGDSGTGKTMSAEVVAADLGLDLYVVDLSTVVDKYVGQTEKNLERIFTEAAGVNGLLLFDEADAIFGKRSEVRDAHDRYANLESAYLLQRMESFDGVAVLTTNLRANLDEAFTRRLDLIIDFAMPDVAQRRALWDRCLGTELPRDDDLDLDFCARNFELSGGSIRACVVTAAYLAAEAGRPVRMADLVGAVQREYRKLGRLLLESEFGEHQPGGEPARVR
ncbi:ATP-binding protein [Micromonospora sp. HM5-17]|uniref:AAA family ATPase n=1 Tax=Micromonospora sp. HM5-17 TaxID=2487710 RepID=UPI000F484668|nr:ATP-binding protein [Micromonospora sp. HM5-17]ROT29443.1 ATP-binding protein [Micromonospora sp. HM5-17]